MQLLLSTRMTPFVNACWWASDGSVMTEPTSDKAVVGSGGVVFAEELPDFGTDGGAVWMRILRVRATVFRTLAFPTHAYVIGIQQSRSSRAAATAEWLDAKATLDMPGCIDNAAVVLGMNSSDV